MLKVPSSAGAHDHIPQHAQEVEVEFEYISLRLFPVLVLLCLLHLIECHALPGQLVHLGCSWSSQYNDRPEAFFHELTKQEINGRC